MGSLTSQDADLGGLRPWWLAGLGLWLALVALPYSRSWHLRRSLTYRLAVDLNASELRPATVVVLILWLGLAALLVSFVRRRLG